MEINTRASHFVLATIKRIYDKLPALIGDDWDNIQSDIDDLIAQLEEKPNQRLTSVELMDLLSEYDAVQMRMKQENTVQAIISIHIQQGMANIAEALGFDTSGIDGLIAAAYKNMQWDVDPKTIPDDEEYHRTVTLNPGGVDSAKSVKFKNMDLDLEKFSSLAAGFITTGYGIVEKPHLVLVAAGTLLTIATLLSTMSIEIDEDEASVFWGFIVATSSKFDKQATEAEILSTTNKEREKYHLEALNHRNFQKAIDRLERIQSIKKVDDDTWQIIERYHIED